MNSMPPKPKAGLPLDAREALDRAAPEGKRVIVTTEFGQVRLVAIPFPGPGDRVASGGVRLGLKQDLGRTLGDLD